MQARFDEQEYEAFQRLVAARQAELKTEGIKVNASDVIRGLVAREVAARGLDKPRSLGGPGGDAPPKPRAEPKATKRSARR